MHDHHHHTYGATEKGSVVLDIGGDTGALIIYTGRDCHGQEIEISPAGPDAADAKRTHAAVRERVVQDGVFYSAVITDLRAGPYTVWWDADTPAGSVTIVGGAVAEFAWPDRPAASGPATA